MALTLQQQIQEFYDASSGLWEQVWGEHMHHGYYGPDGNTRKNRYQAQVDLIEELLTWSRVQSAHRILDVGCGIGGTTLYLAKKFNAEATGITLSPVQANRARERATALGIDARFDVADALAMPFEDASFDLVWSLESGEHMPDKAQFMKECCRVLKPGGKFAMAVWCHRPTDPASGGLLTEDERKHLEKIYQVYCLPYVISLPNFEAIAQDLPFQDIQTADWSTAVSPFWSEVIASAISPAAVIGLIKAGPKTIQAALSMRLMQRGYARGLVRFGVLTATRV
ncbi:MAG: methyltransferase domain-containing protein [Leptolyngbyaceae bacterium]|nr:methyltransferase domain-containing protein [Leptolyngbyaceae bacterium]